MKIVILQSIAGHADPRYDLADFSFAPGESVDIHQDLAVAWVDSGIAVKAPSASLKRPVAQPILSAPYQRPVAQPILAPPDQL